jgi:ribosomal protein S18 acetylase RimI-like enzyme
MPAFTLVPADTLEPAQLHTAFTQAFADYLIGPFEVPLAQWRLFLGRQGMDLRLSRAATTVDGGVLAFCFVAPRPECDSWRLATMGALPAARGSGAAPGLLDDFLARAQAAGAGTVELECFAQNERALRLYRRRGFAEVDALHGYEGVASPAPSASPPSAVTLEDAFGWLDKSVAAGLALPLQVTPRSLRALPDALQAWRHGGAQLVFSQAPAGGLRVHSLVDRDAAQHDAAALVAALLATHPAGAVQVPQLQRHTVGGAALERHGFHRLPLHQLWLRRRAG